MSDGGVTVVEGPAGQKPAEGVADSDDGRQQD